VEKRVSSDVVERFPRPSAGLLYRLVLSDAVETVMVASRGSSGLPDFRAGEFRRLVLCRLPGDAEKNLQGHPWETVYVSSPKLPFLPNSFDCVIAQDVFERRLSSAAAPASARESDAYQGAKLLVSLRTVLRVGGLLLLPVENLLAPRNLIRSIQDALAARPIFRRTYRGYLAALRASGFRDVDAYSVMPSYHYPIYVVSCHYRAVRRFFMREASSPDHAIFTYLIKRSLGVCGVSPYIQHSFLFVCRK